MASKGLGPQPPAGQSSPRSKTAAARAAAGRSKAGRQPGSSGRQSGIPDVVANRMARRIAVASGIPSVMGMAVFVVSYLLVSRQIMELPTGVTLVASGACFLLGVLGLSYGVLSASWESEPGTLLGTEQLGLNIGRLRESLRAMRSGGQQG